jgi:hypothetical protein
MLALCARRHRRGDDQAPDRRGRAGARAARSRLSADPQRDSGRRLLDRGAPLSATQPARAPALWHEPGRADRTGSTPDAFATLPKEWTADQIRSLQDYFDALMSGNLARRRQTKFMPADFKLIEARQPPLQNPQRFWALEQKENIFLTAYAGFPVAPTFMTWSIDWESAWTRSPCASTALSTRIFLDSGHSQL